MTTETSGNQTSQMLFGPTPGEVIAGQQQGSLLQSGLTGLSDSQAIAQKTITGVPVDYRKVATDQLNNIRAMATDSARRQALGLGPNYVSGPDNPYGWSRQESSEQDRIYKALLQGHAGGYAFGTPEDIAGAKKSEEERIQAEAGFVDDYVARQEAAVRQAEASPQAKLQNQLNSYLQQFASSVGQPSIDAATKGMLNMGSNAQAIQDSAGILGPMALGATQGGLNLGTTSTQAITDAANKIGPQSLDMIQKVLNQGLNATPEQLAHIQAISDAAEKQGSITIDQAARDNIRNIVQSMPERGLFGGLNPETGTWSFNADIPDRFNQVGQELVNQKGNLATQLAQFRANSALQYPLQAGPTLLSMAMNANVPSSYMTAQGAGANLLNMSNATNVPTPFLSSLGSNQQLLNSGMGAFATGVQPTLGQMLGNQGNLSSAFTALNTMPWMGLQPAQSVFQSLLQPRMAQMSTNFNQSTGGVIPTLGAIGTLGQGAGGAMMGYGGMTGELRK